MMRLASRFKTNLVLNVKGRVLFSLEDAEFILWVLLLDWRISMTALVLKKEVFFILQQILSFKSID